MAGTALHSNAWHRVSRLRPRLRSHVHIYRHVYRDQIWYVMQDHSNGEFHRYTPEANLLISLMDGRRTVEQIWDLACAQLPDDAMPQDEVIRLLSQLHRADVLLTDRAPDVRDLTDRRRKQRWQKIRQYVGNPSALKIPLIDPDRWLARTLPWVRWLFTPAGALLWIAVVTAGVFQAAMHWQALTHDIWDQVFSAGNVLLMALVYPVVKAIHELGHAYAIKARGGEVHEIGLMFLLMVPVPYVDASASNAFPERRWRMLVGAAGILVEVFLAAVAMLVWVQLEPGLPRSLAYAVVLICGVSTVLMNGNPLLRYDGYYVLADALEMPNLGQRSNAYAGYLFKRYVLLLGEAEAPRTAPGEPFWLCLYAVLAFAYRIFIMVLASLIIMEQFFFFGVILAIWLLVSSVLMPFVRTVRQFFVDSDIQQHRGRCWTLTAACAGVLVLGVAFMPLPDSTLTQGVVWVPPEAQLRAPDQGTIEQVLAPEGSEVEAGVPLFRIESREQVRNLAVLDAQVDEYRARAQDADARNQVQAAIFRHQLGSLESEHRIVQARLAAQRIVSPGAGRFIVAHPGDMTGRPVQRGELIGYVLAGADYVRVVVPQSGLERIQASNRGVRVRLIQQGQTRDFAAHIARRVPAATDELPSMALSLQAGGSIGVDPRKSSQGEAKSAENLFIMDLALPPEAPRVFLGGRVWVKFVHAPRSALAQLYDRVRQLVLREFQV